MHVRAGQTVSVWLGASARDFTTVTGGDAPVRVPLAGKWTARFGVAAPSGVTVSSPYGAGFAEHSFNAA